MKPILKYPGAKWRLSDWIISHMPPHVGYVEPYFGSGAVFFNKKPSHIETVADLDGSIVRFFRTCREQPEALAYAISMTPWSREEFLQSDFGDNNPDDVEAARQFAVRCWMTFGARTHCKTGWRNTTGKTRNNVPDNPAMWRRLPEVITQVADRLRDAQIENRPALDVIQHNNGPETLIYADPPYVKGTRTLNGDQYRFEMTDSDHEELLSILAKHNGMVLLSGYDCDLYRDMLRMWEMKTCNTKAERGVTRLECLWINPLAAERSAQVSLFNISGGGVLLMDNQRIYILKSTFQDQKKRELAMLLLEAGYIGVQIGSEPIPGKAKARRPYIEFWEDPRELKDTEDKP